MAVVTSVCAQTVKIVKVRLLEPGTVVPYFFPITLRVNVNDVGSLHNVQVRIFPKKQLNSIVSNPLDYTLNGCAIYASRVLAYEPNLQAPHIMVDDIRASDFRCVNGQLAPTDFVLVVESVDNDYDDRFLRIAVPALKQYFKSAQSFRVQPPSGQACGTYHAATTQNRPQHRQDSSREAAAAVEATAPPVCIQRVEH
jgi:hypothetical protein